VNVSLQQLKVFVALARHESFTRAGDEIGVTQSAISRCIRELEDAVDLRLFDRTTRQVKVTTVGENLLMRIAPLLTEIEETLCDSHGVRECMRGTVRVASSSALSSGLMPSWLAQSRTRFPDISIVLKDRPQDAVLQSVRSGESDFGIVVSPDDVDELSVQPLFCDPLCVALPRDHRLAKPDRVSWGDLGGEALVILDDDPGARACIDHTLMAHAVQFAVMQDLSHAAAVARMVEAGLGIGIASATAFGGVGADCLAIRPLHPEVRRITMLVRRKNRSLRPNAATVWAQWTAFGKAADTPARPALTTTTTTSVSASPGTPRWQTAAVQSACGLSPLPQNG
jgi:DNA-binding transcriptional LysR family regulator